MWWWIRRASKCRGARAGPRPIGWTARNCYALLLRHWGGERDMWHVVHVPSREVEDARHASRGLTTLQAERTRYRNRIHSLLALHGVAAAAAGWRSFRPARDGARLGRGAAAAGRAGPRAGDLAAAAGGGGERQRGAGRNASRCGDGDRDGDDLAAQRSARCGRLPPARPRSWRMNYSVAICGIGDKSARSAAWCRPRIAVGRSPGTRAWRPVGCPRSAGSPSKSRGRGCGINRAVR